MNNQMASLADGSLCIIRMNIENGRALPKSIETSQSYINEILT